MQPESTRLMLCVSIHLAGLDVGAACAVYQDQVLRDLPCKRIQCDEIWSFGYAEGKNVKTAKAACAVMLKMRGRGRRSAPTQSS
jgi:hypothetical protein